ncbi:MAG: hypothetical protein PHF56_18400 [Desulfuromonadaceae bacterium]|nr:hypothetical protein [Desulfuromonadaceae bacterium]
MKTIMYGLIVLMLLLFPAMNSNAQVNVSIGIGLPNLSIGINLPMYPTLAPVPGYPVYYAPQVDGNYFFYDSMYWVYQDDNWYASSWYNGPWAFVEPMSVPVYVLRIPVRYYRQPPVYFRGWQPNAPPRWGKHWGNDWEHRRSGWDRWNRKAVPARAPQPTYQRQYSGDRYPHVEQQRELRDRSYRYQPRDKAVRRHIQQQKTPLPAERRRQAEPQGRSPRQMEQQRPDQRQQGAPANQHTQPPQRGGENAQHVTPGQPAPQQRGPAQHEQKQQPAAQQREQQAPRQHPAAQQREQQAPRQQGQEKRQEQKQQERGHGQDSGRGHGQGQDKEDDRGRGR